MTKALFIGGGSIGHIAPSVAVFRALKQSKPDTEALFICSNRREETEFLRKEDLSFLPARRLRFSLFSLPAWILTYFQATRVLASFRPSVIFSTGGALSVPFISAAHRRGVPIVLLESDAVSGRANQVMRRWANVICYSFPQEAVPNSSFSILHSQFLFTGHPIRSELTAGSKERGLALTGFSGKKPILLVLGGSQGAAALNSAVTENLSELRKICDVIHLTGEGKKELSDQDGYFARPFVQKELPDLYAASTLSLSRAGASSIAELAANGIPMILVPIRGLAHDHQFWNARMLEDAGGALLLEQENLSTTLLSALTSLLQNTAKQEVMRAALKNFSRGDSAGEIARILLQKGSPYTR